MYVVTTRKPDLALHSPECDLGILDGVAIRVQDVQVKGRAALDLVQDDVHGVEHLSVGVDVDHALLQAVTWRADHKVPVAVSELDVELSFGIERVWLSR